MTSAAAPVIDLEITKGQDFTQTFAWYSTVLVWKAIQAITRGGPCSILSPGHGLVDGQPFWVVGASGMRQINRAIEEDAPYFASIVDADHVAINDLSSWDFTPHVANTGSIVTPTPRDLTGFSAAAMFRTSPNAPGAPVISLTSGAGDIVLDNAAKTITLKLGHALTAAIAQQKLYYDLELVDGAGLVTPIARGWSSWIEEATR